MTILSIKPAMILTRALGFATVCHAEEFVNKSGGKAFHVMVTWLKLHGDVEVRLLPTIE